MRPPTRTTRSTHSLTTTGLSSNKSHKSQPEGRPHKTTHRAIRPCPGPEDGSVLPQNSEDAQAVEYSAHVIPPNGLSIAVPSSDPSSADGSLATSQAEKKPRHRMTDRQTQTLEALFHQNTHPSRAEKENLASELQMDLKTITIWFQNKRQTIKKQRDSTKVFVPPFDGMNALASASALVTPLRLVNGSHPPALYGRSVHADPGPRTISLSMKPPTATLLASASSHSTMPQSSPLDPFTMIHCQPRLATSALIPIPIIHPRHIPHYQPQSLQPHPAPLPTYKTQSSVNAHDLWKHLPSSPPEEAYSAHPSPDLHGFQSHDLSNNDLMAPTYQRPRTLEWACAQVSKRRRLETRDDVFADANFDVGLDSDEETKGDDKDLVEASPYAELISSSAVLATSPSLSLSDTRVPQEYLAAFPPDVVRGAQLLLALKQSLVSRSTS